MPAKAFDVIPAVYASLVFLGGLLGYVNKGSTVSMVSGTVFGILLALASYRFNKDPTRAGLLVASAGLLALMMAYRTAKTGKLVPAGVVAFMSFWIVFRYIDKVNTYGWRF